MSSSSPVSPNRRWFVAAGAVGLHVSIGAIYAYSVYTKPLMEALGWKYKSVTLAFSLAIGCLGLAAAFLGPLVEKHGPRLGARLAALCYGGGLLLAGLAVQLGSLPLFYLGYGVLAGVGLGVGYITPVASLIRWFPDRRGLATGLAIMGFGFGAFVGGPPAVKLIDALGLAGTFYALGVGYGLVILACAQVIAPPPTGWAPGGGSTAVSTGGYGGAGAKAGAGGASAPAALTRGEALRTGRFWLLWSIFFINVTCGIAVISVASPLAQDIARLTVAQATAMVGLMGLFNGLGRIGWSALSDKLGRGRTLLLFFALEGVAFLLLPSLGQALLFQALLFLIISCYGGGFAIMPAYVGDLFGVKNLSAIYGCLLTAWSAAGVVGPMLAATVREQTGSFSLTLRGFAAGFVVAAALAVWLQIAARRAVARAEP